MKASAGFTLMELVVVMLILGVVGAVAVPAFAVFERNEGLEAAERLADAYREARKRATTRGTRVSVLVEGATATWALVEGEGSDLRVVARGALAGPGSELGIRMVTAGAGRAALATFDALGRARADRVVFTHGGGSYTVAVDPWTSMIRVVGSGG